GERGWRRAGRAATTWGANLRGWRRKAAKGLDERPNRMWRAARRCAVRRSPQANATWRRVRLLLVPAPRQSEAAYTRLPARSAAGLPCGGVVLVGVPERAVIRRIDLH